MVGSGDRLIFHLRLLFSISLLLTVATVVQCAITLSSGGRAGLIGLVAATTEVSYYVLYLARRDRDSDFCVIVFHRYICVQRHDNLHRSYPAVRA
jgi:hypothetical protein